MLLRLQKAACEEFTRPETAISMRLRFLTIRVRVKLPGHYERLEEVVECTPLGYALRFPGSETKTVALLRQRGAAE